MIVRGGTTSHSAAYDWVNSMQLSWGFAASSSPKKCERCDKFVNSDLRMGQIVGTSSVLYPKNKPESVFMSIHWWLSSKKCQHHFFFSQERSGIRQKPRPLSRNTARCSWGGGTAPQGVWVSYNTIRFLKSDWGGKNHWPSAFWGQSLPYLDREFVEKMWALLQSQRCSTPSGGVELSETIGNWLHACHWLVHRASTDLAQVYWFIRSPNQSQQASQVGLPQPQLDTSSRACSSQEDVERLWVVLCFLCFEALQTNHSFQREAKPRSPN